MAETLANFRGPLLRAMMEQGHCVTGCAPGNNPQVRKSLAELGVDYRSFPMRRAAMNPFSDAASLAALVRLFRQLRPDKILCYTIKPVVYGSLAARMARVPEIFSMITGIGYAFSGAGRKSRVAGAAARLLYRFGLRENRRVFFQNPDDRDLFVRLGLLPGTDRAVLINGSGVDLDRFRWTPLPATPSFLMIARLLADKGVREYVEAARRVRRRHPEVPFRLAGWIDANPTAISSRELETWVEEGAIEYLGRLADVRPAIAGCSVYVLPSYREGTPRTVLEAMAMGRPVITTDAAGCRETVVDRHTGWLVPPRDAGALSEAMERSLASPSELATMGRRARERAEGKYDVRHVNTAILTAMGLCSGG
jgi:glycosyltransferase involved in cell wall biosynthesis